MRRSTLTECSIEGCSRPVCARGWCKLHYDRWSRLGDPLASVSVLHDPTIDFVTKFWMRVEKESDGCHNWTGLKNPKGYGKMRFVRDDGSICQYAHQWVWEQEHGRVPKGMTLDHYVCDNESCVRVSHMRITSVRENVLRSDGIAARNLAKTHCKYGHPFTGENLKIRANGGRSCAICMQKSGRETHQRRKQQQKRFMSPRLSSRLAQSRS